MYPGKGTVVLIRPAQTFYERIILWKQRSIKEDPYHKDQFTYDEDNDCYYCPSSPSED